MVFEKVEASDRFMRGAFKRGTGTNPIKNLAEMIKNSDDAYDELQQQKIDTTGIIEVGFWKNGKRGIDAFCIRDYGVGMSREEARKAFELFPSDENKKVLDLIQSKVSKSFNP